ncbi:MAG: tight adherence protein [Actinomycetota bacterium]|nr:tight adherence protein [Actinomycetota bacterium]
MIAIVALSIASAASLHAAQRATASSAVRGRFELVDRADSATRSSWLAGALRDAAIEVPTSTVRRAWIAGFALVVATALVAGGSQLAALASLAAAPGPVLALHLLRGRRDRLIDASLPDVLDAVARSLRSGASLRQAIDEAAAAAHGPMAFELQRVAGAVRDGVPLPDALDRWSRERPLSGIRLATAALGLGAETGGASAQAVDGLAATLRNNLAIAAEVRALASQARYSALVIALAPIAFTALAAATVGRTASFLLRTRAGLVCLSAGLGLDLLGGLWMRRLTSVAA